MRAGAGPAKHRLIGRLKIGQHNSITRTNLQQSTPLLALTGDELAIRPLRHLVVGPAGNVQRASVRRDPQRAVTLVRELRGNDVVEADALAGADADVASVTLSTRGVCNILFLSGTACVLTGNIA